MSDSDYQGSLMPTPITLFSINHKKNRTSAPIVGGIVKEFVVGQDDKGELLPGYCDMAAPYHIWKEKLVPAIVGFHGYRKHINFRDSWNATIGALAPGWHHRELSNFQQYQTWLTTWDAREITHEWMLKHDVLTVEPFNCAYNGGMAQDYALSRSALDWAVLEAILRDRGFDNAAFDTPYIRPMHFVMRDHTFCRWMRFWNDIRLELEPAVYSDDAKSDVAKIRALAFLSERIWSLWLDRAQLRLKTFPLMICWEAE